AVVKGAVNAFDVFYRNPRNELQHAYLNGAGWQKEPLKGVIITNPAAVASEPGKIDLVAFGGDYKLYHWRLTRAGASPFKLVEGSAPGLGDPVLVSRGPKRLDIVYRGFDGGPHPLHLTPDPPPWVAQAVGGTLFDFPTAVALPDGSLRVYVRGEGSRLVEAAQPKQGAPWQWTAISDLTGGQRIAGSPSASVQGPVVTVHA